jgi:hypothetical protein
MAYDVCMAALLRHPASGHCLCNGCRVLAAAHFPNGRRLRRSPLSVTAADLAAVRSLQRPPSSPPPALCFVQRPSSSLPPASYKNGRRLFRRPFSLFPLGPRGFRPRSPCCGPPFCGPPIILELYTACRNPPFVVDIELPHYRLLLTPAFRFFPASNLAPRACNLAPHANRPTLFTGNY